MVVRSKSRFGIVSGFPRVHGPLLVKVHFDFDNFKRCITPMGQSLPAYAGSAGGSKLPTGPCRRIVVSAG